MGLFDEFVGGEPPRPEELARPQASPVPRITVTPPSRGNLFEEFVGGSRPPTPPPPAPLNKPFGELKPADPSWTEWAKSKGQDVLMGLGAKPHVARHLSEAGVNIGSTLTPMGSVLAGADLTYNLPRGNLIAAGFDALGTIPGITAARRAIRGTPTVRTAETPSVTDLERSARDAYRASERSPLEYHPDAMSNYAARARAYLESPYHGTGTFSPEKAPEVYATLERFERAFPAGGRRPVTASDFDTLRQQLRGLGGPSGPAGRQAVDVLDTMMLRPPQGMLTRGTPQDLADLRQSFLQARGDWRAAKTAEGVEDAIDYAGIKAGRAHSGKNQGNALRQELSKFVASDAGQQRLFGATPGEREAIVNAVVGDRRTNLLRSTSNLLGGGGGLGRLAAGGAGSGAGAYLAAQMGLDPVSAAALAVTGGAITPATGAMLRNAANTRSLRAAENVAEDIARNSPLYRAREAVSPPIADPRVRARDAITQAMMPQVRDWGTEWANNLYVPYENR